MLATGKKSKESPREKEEAVKKGDEEQRKEVSPTVILSYLEAEQKIYGSIPFELFQVPCRLREQIKRLRDAHRAEQIMSFTGRVSPCNSTG
ncbi:hypothetical protein Ancab_010434 [Ancistrocladus abbreviatus]